MIIKTLPALAVVVFRFHAYFQTINRFRFAMQFAPLKTKLFLIKQYLTKAMTGNERERYLMDYISHKPLIKRFHVKFAMPNFLTIAILSKNSSATIDQALESVRSLLTIYWFWMTTQLTIRWQLLKHNALVFQSDTNSFAQKREEVLAHTKTQWLFYLDADEVITPELTKFANYLTQTLLTQKITMRLVPTWSLERIIF